MLGKLYKTVIGAKIHKIYVRSVIKECETKFISQIPFIKLLLVGLCEIWVILGWLSCGIKERGFVTGGSIH